MKNLKILLIFFFTLLLLMSAQSMTFADIYLNIPNVEGEALDQDYVEWIDVDAYHFEYLSTQISSGRKGMVEKTPLTITKHMDKSTPLLFNKLSRSESLGDIILVVTYNDGDRRNEFVRITFTKAMVMSISNSVKDEVPMDQIQFTFNSVKIEYQNGMSMFEE